MRNLFILLLLSVSFLTIGQTKNLCNPNNAEDKRMVSCCYENATYFFGCKDYLRAITYLHEAEKILPYCTDIRESLALCYWEYYLDCTTFDPKNMLEAKKYLEFCMNDDSIPKNSKKDYKKYLAKINSVLDKKLEKRQYDDGMYYGEMFENKRCGWGVFNYNNGQRYAGRWFDDKKEDVEGELYNSKNELIYKGVFLDDKMQNNQNLYFKEEIKYWKSVENSDDIVSYRQYLKKYGEIGLYKDEAYTKIALLQLSGKKVKSNNSIDCYFYTGTGNLIFGYDDYHGKPRKFYIHDCIVVKFDNKNGKLWLRGNDYEKVKQNLVSSKYFYENDKWGRKRKVGKKRKSERDDFSVYNYWEKYGEIIRHSDEEYTFSQTKSTSEKDVYFKRDTHYTRIKNEESHLTHGYRYLEFPKDKSSIMTWFEEDDNSGYHKYNSNRLEIIEYHQKSKDYFLR